MTILMNVAIHSSLAIWPMTGQINLSKQMALTNESLWWSTTSVQPNKVLIYNPLNTPSTLVTGHILSIDSFIDLLMYQFINSFTHMYIVQLHICMISYLIWLLTLNFVSLCQLCHNNVPCWSAEGTQHSPQNI